MSSPTVRDRAAQVAQAQVAHVDAVERDAAGLRVVEARDERRERRLARARAADQGDGAAGGEREVEVAQHGPVGVVAERDVARSAARRRPRAARGAPAGSADLRLFVEQLEDALAGGDGALVLADPHADHAQRPDQHARGRGCRRRTRPARAACRSRAGRRPGRSPRRPAAAGGRAAAGSAPGCAPSRSRARTRARPASAKRDVSMSSCAKALTTRTPTIDSSACVVTSAMRCWTSRSTGMRAARVAGRDDGDRREQHERDQRELPARDHEQHRGRDQRRAVLRDEDEAVAQEHAHGADVARRAREQLARSGGGRRSRRRGAAGACRAPGAGRTRRSARGGPRSGAARPSGAADARPAATISPAHIHRPELFSGLMAWLMARPVRSGMASAKPCAASARRIDHTSSRRCAAAKPSRRRNVVGGVEEAVKQSENRARSFGAPAYMRTRAKAPAFRA